MDVEVDSKVQTFAKQRIGDVFNFIFSAHSVYAVIVSNDDKL